MAHRIDKVYLADILDSIARVRGLLSNVTREAFHKDRDLKELIAFHFIAIGEACNRLSDEFIEAHPEAPWPQIVGMRNRIVHDYFAIDYDRIWDAAINNLPILESLVSRWLEEAK